MKKLLCLLSAALMLLTAVGCKTTEEIISVSDQVVTKATTTAADGETENTTADGETKGTTATKPTRGKTTKKTGATEKVQETGDYVFLDTRTVEEWRYVEFAEDFCGNALYIPIPSDWIVAEGENGFSFSVGGAAIGSASYATPVTPTKIYLGQVLNMGGNYASRAVHETVSGGTSTFQWAFSFEAEGVNTLYFTIDYTQLSQSSVDFMLDVAAVHTVNGNLTPAYGKEGTILIADDADAADAKLADTLSDMLTAGGKSKYSVTDASAAGATLSTYASEAWLQRIRSKEFAMVFLGAFESSDKPSLDRIRTACSESGTKLVFLPGYTDNDSVRTAVKSYSAVPYLDWKAELTALVGSGVNSADLHTAEGVSTPLAGYVGAHMIYRSLFGDLPPTVSATATAKAKLDFYPETGRPTGAEAFYAAG